MKVVSFVTQKGGSGKSTLAFSLAVAAQQAGLRVYALDMDKQATLLSWYRDREDDKPPVDAVEAAKLGAALKALEQTGHDLVLIDTAGRDDPSTATAIRVSTLCIIPCRPTPADMKATTPTIETITRLGKQAAFVLTQTPARSFRIREAERALSILGLVAPVQITARNDHQDAQGAGLGVTEYDSAGKAAQEIRQLWGWLQQKLGKLNHGQAA